MDVKTALANYETSSDGLVGADGNLSAAQQKQADAQAKLTAANQGVTDAQTADNSAAQTYNQSVDDLVAALAATKRVVGAAADTAAA